MPLKMRERDEWIPYGMAAVNARWLELIYHISRVPGGMPMRPINGINIRAISLFIFSEKFHFFAVFHWS